MNKNTKRVIRNQAVLDKIRYGMFYDCKDSNYVTTEHGLYVKRFRIKLDDEIVVSCIYGEDYYSKPRNSALSPDELIYFETYVFSTNSDEMEFKDYLKQQNIALNKDINKKALSIIDTEFPMDNPKLGPVPIHVNYLQYIYTKYRKLIDKTNRRNKNVHSKTGS